LIVRMSKRFVVLLTLEFPM